MTIISYIHSAKPRQYQCTPMHIFTYDEVTQQWSTSHRLYDLCCTCVCVWVCVCICGVIDSSMYRAAAASAECEVPWLVVCVCAHFKRCRLHMHTLETNTDKSGWCLAHKCIWRWTNNTLTRTVIGVTRNVYYLKKNLITVGNDFLFLCASFTHVKLARRIWGIWLQLRCKPLIGLSNAQFPHWSKIYPICGVRAVCNCRCCVRLYLVVPLRKCSSLISMAMFTIFEALHYYVFFFAH